MSLEPSLERQLQGAVDIWKRIFAETEEKALVAARAKRTLNDIERQVLTLARQLRRQAIRQSGATIDELVEEESGRLKKYMQEWGLLPEEEQEAAE